MHFDLAAFRAGEAYGSRILLSVLWCAEAATVAAFRRADRYCHLSWGRGAPAEPLLRWFAMANCNSFRTPAAASSGAFR